MRGKVRMHEGKLAMDRITPAYAGKSWQLLFWAYYCRDHPRLCGEKHYTPFGNFCQAGSPPPMRGKAALCGEFAFYSGITPAYAGKSNSEMM